MLLGLIGFLCVGCTPEEKATVKAAEKLANEVVQSQCFQDEMESVDLVWTNGRSPRGVVGHLRNTKVTANVHYYYEPSRTVGYRTPHEELSFQKMPFGFLQSPRLLQIRMPSQASL